MADLDWNLIRSFVAVAETGSLSAAARRLAASQPTLGRHVAELEQALGVVLFRRGRRGYELTEQGVALFERARAVGEAANAFARLATGATEQVAGTRPHRGKRGGLGLCAAADHGQARARRSRR